MRVVAILTTIIVLLGPSAVARDPDLIVDEQQLANFWYIEERYFPPDHCAVIEGCVASPGARKLLRFRTTAANISRVDLEFGDPSTNPLFHFSPCHGHFHFEEYADYRLKDLGGTIVAPGHKQAFCLQDTIQYLFEPWVKSDRRYNCGFQGIQGGWSDIYGAVLDCQWVDITDVPPGSYILENEVNPAAVIIEEDYTNNVAAVQVEVTDVVGILHRPDGWIIPGSQMRVGREAGFERVLYDVEACPAADYNILYGLAPVRTYTYFGALCDIGASGDALVALPDPPPGGLLWWTIVGVDPAVLPQAEGGHGFDSNGRRRPLSGVGFCGVNETSPRVICPN